MAETSSSQPYWIRDAQHPDGYFDLPLSAALTSETMPGGVLDFSSPSLAGLGLPCSSSGPPCPIIPAVVYFSLFFFCNARAIYKMCAWMYLASR
ncbi:LHFPL tetraspan subfamily member 5 protein [Lates japonicus]|uniref:LHFPL tetraspan subfamily member 5 protein n=1 Tax=Lates japonicus TaxID=270547 RepID=A0AAD3MG67_LATJO|nr:LHFPL tetraspan subfamily member 5 protein [Lates japonicus]